MEINLRQNFESKFNFCVGEAARLSIPIVPSTISGTTDCMEASKYTNNISLKIEDCSWLELSLVSWCEKVQLGYIVHQTSMHEGREQSTLVSSYNV